LLLLFITINCTNMEPAFTVKGDPAITKDVKVNVEMIKDDGTNIATVFYNGDSYEIDNEGALRYTIYVSYKNNFYYVSETDNLHGKIKGEPINEIIIAKKDDAIVALYRPMNESDTVGGTILEPANTFFADLPQEAIEKQKQKFTTLYKK
jgi:hypothetical protein